MKGTKRLFIFLLLFILLFTQRAGAVNVPPVSARAAVLIEAESGRILYGKNENLRRGMASTTKIMTAVVALEKLPLDKKVTVAPAAVGVEGSSVYLSAGEIVTAETLLYALMLQSANDAAAALAFEVAGGIEAFAVLMNEKAASLGLRDTHFMNPHGLDDENHYTTAYELARIAAYALENEEFARIVSTKKKTVPLHNSEVSRLLVNHNRLLRLYDDIIGVKTGFTKKCGRTLVSAAERDGVRLICVTLDDGDDWRDHRALLDYGFSLYERVTLAKEGELCFRVPVCGGVSDAVSVKNAEALEAVLPRARGALTVKTELPRFLYGGVHKGEPVGRAIFYMNGAEVGSVTLSAAEDVPCPPKKPSFWQRLLSVFRK